MDLGVETLQMFGARGHPHATIVTIQPQQTKTTKLMYTEFWILYYWAVRLCERVRYNYNKTLPVSLRCSIIMLTSANAISSDSYHYAVGRRASSRPFSAPGSFAV